MLLSQLEGVAERLLEQQQRLREVEEELKHVELDLKEQPKRGEKEKRFYALIGLQWQESEELKLRQEVLVKKRQRAQELISEARDKILKGFSSGQLVIPLDPKPERSGNNQRFRYRANGTFPNSVKALSALVGIPAPIKVDDVVIAPDQITVADPDPYSAMQKIVEAFEKIRKTVALKLRAKR